MEEIVAAALNAEPDTSDIPETKSERSKRARWVNDAKAGETLDAFRKREERLSHPDFIRPHNRQDDSHG